MVCSRNGDGGAQERFTAFGHGAQCQHSSTQATARGDADLAKDEASLSFILKRLFDSKPSRVTDCSIKAVFSGESLPLTLAQRLRLVPGMKRIHIIADENAINSQARTYAEYRVFSALTRQALEFRRARVLLRQSEDRGTFDRVICAVSIALEPSGMVRVRATGPHVYAAINRAVERLRDVLGERIEQRRSS